MTYTENAMLHEKYEPAKPERTAKTTELRNDICSDYTPVETRNLLSWMSNSYVCYYSCDNCANCSTCSKCKHSS